MKWRSLEESNPGIDTRTLREQLAERKELIAKYVPLDAQAVHVRAIAELQRQRILDRVLPVGAKYPPFELADHNGNAVSSSEELGRGLLIICFFRGRWCPFCVAQLEAMNRIVPEIKKAAATLMAISPQTVQQSFFMADQHKLRFPVLSDRGTKLRGSSALSTGSRSISRKFTAARSSICRLPMEMKAGSCPLLRHSSWIETRPSSMLPLTPITPSAPSQQKFWNDSRLTEVPKRCLAGCRKTRESLLHNGERCFSAA